MQHVSREEKEPLWPRKISVYITSVLYPNNLSTSSIAQFITHSYTVQSAFYLAFMFHVPRRGKFAM